MKDSCQPCLRQCEDKIESEAVEMETPKAEKRRILLHSCCGPCSTACVERLMSDYRITVFYYNPNVTDREEYEKRRDNQIKFLNALNADLPEEDRVVFIEGEYFPEDFYGVTEGLEDCPEGGERCTECFKLRLERTAKAAVALGYDIFGTTLTVSPHKNYQLISMIGRTLAEVFGLECLDMDFKKKAGYQRSIELSRKYELYRQNYCGCSFSKRD